MISKFSRACAVFATTSLLGATCIAQPASVVVKGQQAPHSGLLLSKEAAAQVMASTQQKVEIERAKCTLELGRQRAEAARDLALCSTNLQDRLAQKQKEVQALTNDINQARWIWGSVGLVAGVVIGGATVRILWK